MHCNKTRWKQSALFSLPTETLQMSCIYAGFLFLNYLCSLTVDSSKALLSMSSWTVCFAVLDVGCYGRFRWGKSGRCNKTF